MPRRNRDARLAGAILIRTSKVGDEPAHERLAALEGRTLPQCVFLLAEVGGELVAAAPLDVEGEPLGDPFLPTADLCELLQLHARQRRRRHREWARGLGSRPATLREAT